MSSGSEFPVRRNRRFLWKPRAIRENVKSGDTDASSDCVNHHVHTLLTDTIQKLCQSNFTYEFKVNFAGQLSFTVDNQHSFKVNLDRTFYKNVSDTGDFFEGEEADGKRDEQPGETSEDEVIYSGSDSRDSTDSINIKHEKEHKLDAQAQRNLLEVKMDLKEVDDNLNNNNNNKSNDNQCDAKDEVKCCSVISSSVAEAAGISLPSLMESPVSSQADPMMTPFGTVAATPLAIPGLLQHIMAQMTAPPSVFPMQQQMFQPNPTTVLPSTDLSAPATQTAVQADPPPEDSSLSSEVLPKPSKKRQRANYNFTLSASGEFCCDQCPKAFKCRATLRKHYRIHTGERPYTCEFCGRAFRGISERKRHEMAHRGEISVTCPVCSKGFGQAHSLKRHMRVHTGERPHQCILCGKKYPEKRNLQLHMRIHTGEKPFPCRMCDMKFIDSSSQKRHENQHLNKRYPCTCCSKTFSQTFLLNKHLRNDHNVVPPKTIISRLIVGPRP